ncbi:MAG: MaoC family dehydratase N-terminal domain-containing protein [Bauldia sp.]|uniref:FAS1-like dehydratase domain-containing protein n=1 Tax=Bauldia sp. TaxID=2575872 RepID=UPI001D1FAE14|nr:MaoC family dehydratase N-terminal domain-containing protein [Bauldia sp.]MCB1497644.1 MaoC family dehydratase N-terminal domain-containing protein [Bauldia sp.]
MTDWSDWIGRRRTIEDLVTPAMVAGLNATLDAETVEQATGAAPQAIHWLLARLFAPMREIDSDGHPRRGGFLPPIPLPRRMWAASDVTFAAPIMIGEPLKLDSVVSAITPKSGSTGELVFVEIAHTVTAGGAPRVREKQTVVFRGAGRNAGAGPEAAPDADFVRDLIPDPVMLFRYSALTFNAHRIHYDRPYAREVEGYPDLVVHGPLTASLLIDLCSRALGANRLATFAFRAIGPAYVGEPLRLAARRTNAGFDLEAAASGKVTMRASATLA